MKLSLRTTHTPPLSHSPVIQAARILQHQKPVVSRAHGCTTILPDTHHIHRAINFQFVKEGSHAPTFASVKKFPSPVYGDPVKPVADFMPHF
ncbi:MAG: hypothetical protein GY726_15865 [Proteobacteria bacterium]|nr:hypothetical protein [Pseudomonadota bacterium]